MRFEKLEIKGFGKIDGLSLELIQGLNIIYGSNESGKSTVQAFIKAMLYGLKGGRAGKDGELPSNKRYKPWSSPNYSGFMEYRLDDHELYRVGRNFEDNTVRIFDSLFNDITGSFSVGKDKSIQFAEKHLGLNEACFERTVFVKQMDTRVQDGNRELLNRLSNVYTAGSDDVSFKRAEEALKNALKKYVGTDRSSTRPLDRIQEKLEELTTARAGLLDRRKFQFNLEEQLRQKAAEKEMLQGKKQVYEILREALRIQEDASRQRLKISDLEQLVTKAADLELQRVELKNRLSEIQGEAELFSAFSCFNEEDLDAASQDYNRLISLEEYKGRIEEEIRNKNRELEELELTPETGDSGKGFSTGTEQRVQALCQEIEELKPKCDRKPLDELEEKLEQMNAGARGMKTAFLSSGLAAAVLLASGIAGWTLGYTLCMLLTIVTGIFFYLSIRSGKEQEKLAKKRRFSLTELNQCLQLLQSKRKELLELYQSAGVSGYEEFIRRKALYDSRVDTALIWRHQSERLQTEKHSIERKVSITRSSLLERLFTAGIVQEHEERIGEELIKQFRQGIHGYKEHMEELTCTEQRLRDIETSLEDILHRASETVQKACRSKDELSAAGKELEKLLEIKDRDAQALMEKAAVAYGRGEFADLWKGYEGGETLEVGRRVDQDNQALQGRWNELLLEIKELEVTIKGLEASDDRLQRLEEEVAQLEEKRRNLEGTGEALKLALDTLAKASGEIQRDYAPVLNSRMSEITAKLTGGRYTSLKADSGLALRALTPETGDIVGVTMFSGGTVDSMYLAMRIALADVLSVTSEKLPLILDEVFAQYDDARTRNTLFYLKELAKERQILFLTCKSREIELAAEVCGKEINLITL